jgi:hypothetical protein
MGTQKVGQEDRLHHTVYDIGIVGLADSVSINRKKDKATVRIKGHEIVYSLRLSLGACVVARATVDGVVMHHSSIYLHDGCNSSEERAILRIIADVAQRVYEDTSSERDTHTEYAMAIVPTLFSINE